MKPPSPISIGAGAAATVVVRWTLGDARIGDQRVREVRRPFEEHHHIAELGRGHEVVDRVARS